MMDLQTLRVNRTPVSENSKCDGCVHYDGNAAAKGGACEVGQAPALCGNGSEPKYGYAALADLSPDEVDDLATPLLTGSQGTMNEHGDIEKTIMMKRVCLGDDDLTIAQRIHGELVDYTRKSFGYAQGEVNPWANAELAQQRIEHPEYPMVQVAKSLHDMYLSPRKQHKYGVADVLAFLQSRGMPVTSEEMEVCKSRFGDTRQVPVGHAENPTLPQAAAGLRAHNSATRAPGGAGSAPNVQPMKTTRNRTPTQPIAMAKSKPEVNLTKADISDDDDEDEEDVIRKSGEGTRGGHIIGHTKSGKAVYGLSKKHMKRTHGSHVHREAMNHEATRNAYNRAHHEHAEKHGFYQDWDAQDHRDAQSIYDIEKEKAIASARLAGHTNPIQSHEAQQNRAVSAHHLRFEDIHNDSYGEPGMAHKKIKRIYDHEYAHSKPSKKSEPKGFGHIAGPGERDPMKKSGGEGSHGGHIIGHTRSGKPIYGDKHPGNYGKNFSGADHKDASNAHSDAAANASSAFIHGGESTNRADTHRAHAKEHARVGAKLSKVKKSLPNVRRID